MAHGGRPRHETIRPTCSPPVRAWREKRRSPGELIGSRTVDGKKEWEMPVYPYPKKNRLGRGHLDLQGGGWPRGGVEPVAEEVPPGGDGVGLRAVSAKLAVPGRSPIFQAMFGGKGGFVGADDPQEVIRLTHPESTVLIGYLKTE